MAECPYCHLKDVDTLETVCSGCKAIDAALEKFTQAASTAANASSILNHNSLEFGSGENATLEQALDELGTMISKSMNANDGLTATIIAQANAQQAAWEANVAACRAKAEAEEAEKNKKK